MPTHGIGRWRHLLPRGAPKKKKDRHQMKEILAETATAYGTLNVVVSGYDMTLVEHYSQYIHNLCNRLGIKVAERYVLLGEACYPLQSWLMKAYPEERGRRASQRLFNSRLARALRAAEEALLRLRARWQCLSKRNDCGLDVVPTMVLACCILHNMCESHGDAFKAEWQVEVAEAESPQPGHKPLPCSVEHGHAEETRSLFCDYFEEQNI